MQIILLNPDDEEYEEIINATTDSAISPFYIHDEYIYKLCDSKDKKLKDSGYKLLERVCLFMEVNRVLTNVNTGYEMVEISYYSKTGIKKLLTPISYFSTKCYHDLADKGVNINEVNIKNVIEYIYLSYKNAPYECIHSSLGWVETDIGNSYYTFSSLKGDSEYSGDFDLQPKGTLDGWLGVIKNEVIGHTPMELMLVIGFSSILIQPLKEASGVSTLFTHLVNDCSTGKTTAEMVAVSPFGKPSINGGLIKAWTATDNSLLKYFENNFGVCLVIDESSANPKQDMSSTIYQFSQGRGRERLNSNSNLRKAANWSTTIISSGENSLRQRANENNGLSVRLLEISGITFTKNAKNSDAIREGLMMNYGYAANILARFISKVSHDELVELFNKNKQRIAENMVVTDSFTDRILNPYGIIMTTAILVKSVLNLDLDVGKIMRLLIKLEMANMPSRDMSTNAHKYLLDYFVINKSNFFTGSHRDYRNNASGMYNVVDGKYEIAITKEKFEEAMKKGGFTNTNLILKKWKDKGILIPTKDDHLAKRRKFGDKLSVYVYVIRFEIENVEDETYYNFFKDEPLNQNNLFELPLEDI